MHTNTYCPRLTKMLIINVQSSQVFNAAFEMLRRLLLMPFVEILVIFVSSCKEINIFNQKLCRQL